MRYNESVIICETSELPTTWGYLNSSGSRVIEQINKTKNKSINLKHSAQCVLCHYQAALWWAFQILTPSETTGNPFMSVFIISPGDPSSWEDRRAISPPPRFTDDVICTNRLAVMNWNEFIFLFPSGSPSTAMGFKIFLAKSILVCLFFMLLHRWSSQWTMFDLERFPLKGGSCTNGFMLWNLFSWHGNI